MKLPCSDLTVKKAEDHISNFQNWVARTSITDNESVNLSAAVRKVCIYRCRRKVQVFWPLTHCSDIWQKKCIMYLSTFPSDLTE